MAGHPLRPATRQSLGRPLPHQQADRPRAHPPPKKLSNPHDAAEAEYPVLAPVSEGYPKAEGRLLTCYSPVRRSSTPERAFPLDLHVLSTPPAFVLSQDQTLQRKNGKTLTTNKQQFIAEKKLRHWHTNTLLSSQRTSPASKLPSRGSRSILHTRQRLSNLQCRRPSSLSSRSNRHHILDEGNWRKWQTGRPPKGPPGSCRLDYSTR